MSLQEIDRELGGVRADSETLWVGPQKHIMRRFLEPSGVDDTARFIAAQAAGGVWRLRDDRFGPYRISSKVQLAAKGGFVCEEGMASILMLSGAGKFANAQHATRYASNTVLFQGALRSRLNGLSIAMQPATTVRVLSAFDAQLVDEWEVEDIELSGFQTGRLIAWRSCNGARVKRVRAHDIGHDFTTLTSDQMSIVESDNDRPAGVNSLNCHIEDIRGRSIVMGAAAKAAYGGNQTDLVNIQGPSQYAGHTIRELVADGLGEVLDIWASGCIVRDIHARNTENFVVKAIYGSADLDVQGVYSDGCRLATIVVGNSVNPNGNGAVRGHSFRGLHLLNCGKDGGGPGILLEGESTSDQDKRPAHCTFEGFVRGYSPAVCSAGLFAKNVGEGNRGRLRVENAAADVVSLYGDRAWRVENQRPIETRIRATLTSTVTLNTNEVIPWQTIDYDEAGEFTVTAGKMTCKTPGWYRVTVQFRTPARTAGQSLGFEVRVDGVSKKTLQRVSAGGDDIYEGSTIVYLTNKNNPADSNSAANELTVRLLEDASGSINLTGAANVSWIEIERVL